MSNVDKMNKIITNCIFFVLILFIAFTTLSSSLYKAFLSESVGKEFRDFEFMKKGDGVISYESFKLSSGFLNNPQGVYSIFNDSISNKYGQKYNNVEVVRVSPNITDFIPIRLIAGSFISSSDEEKGRAVAIISDKMALALFNSKEIIGNEIMIGRTYYRIIGVYNRDKSVVHKFTEKGKDQIFIPMREDSIIGGFMLSSKNKQELKGIMVERFNNTYSGGYSYRVIENKNPRGLMTVYNIVNGLLSLLIIGFLLYFNKESISILVHGYKVKNRETYMLDTLKQNFIYMIPFILLLLITAISISILFKLMVEAGLLEGITMLGNQLSLDGYIEEKLKDTYNAHAMELNSDYNKAYFLYSIVIFMASVLGLLLLIFITMLCYIHRKILGTVIKTKTVIGSIIIGVILASVCLNILECSVVLPVRTIVYILILNVLQSEFCYNAFMHPYKKLVTSL